MLRKAFLIVAAALAAAALTATAAEATPPAPVTITVDGTLAGPSTVIGTWTATGLFQGSGTYVEEFRFAGSTVHVVKTFTSSSGSFVLKAQAVTDISPQGLVTFRAGSWLIVASTGAYAGLHAGGSPAVDGFGNLVTGQVHGVHEGTGHFE